MFRIGSVSKPVTAFAVGLLVEQGKLDLDAPVQMYVPAFPEKKWPISTRQAAGHIAGIRHYRGAEFLSSQYYATVEGGLKIFQDDDLLTENEVLLLELRLEPGERGHRGRFGRGVPGLHATRGLRTPRNEPHDARSE